MTSSTGEEHEAPELGVDFGFLICGTHSNRLQFVERGPKELRWNLGASLEVFFVRSTLEPWSVSWVNYSNMGNVSSASESIKCNENVNLRNILQGPDDIFCMSVI